MRYEEACHWIKLNYITQASNLDQVKEKEALENNLVQELVIIVKFIKWFIIIPTIGTRFYTWCT